MNKKSKNINVEDLNEKLSEKGISSEMLNGALDKNKFKAEEMLKNKEKTHRLLNGARDLCAKTSKKLANIPYVGGAFEDTAIACDMIADYVDGKYREVPIASIITMLAAIIYLVNPIDIIPDIVPVLGQADDAAVLLLAFRAIDNDIQSYAAWKAEQLDLEVADNCSDEQE